jgi:magnesium chelatase family protein
MHAQIHTVAFRGIDTIEVTVQIHIGSGLPTVTIVGLADKSVAGSSERVRAALSSLGLALPPKRIAVNLAPADLLKEGAHFDLPFRLRRRGGMGRWAEHHARAKPDRIDQSSEGTPGAAPAQPAA